MAEEPHSGTESDNSSSGEQEEEEENTVTGITEYEKQRLERIKENKARLEALRLPSLASSLLNTLQKKHKKGKGKKVVDDDEYKPSDGEDKGSFSSSSDDEEERFNDSEEDFIDGSRKGKRPQSLKKSKQKAKASAKKHVRKLDFVDDEEALRQAIALSLADSSDITGAVRPGPTERCRADVAAMGNQERKGRSLVHEEADKRMKKRRVNMNRQINEDQVIIHFFQFDEAGKGSITMKDLQRVAVDHDFSWSDKEIADMIQLFDNDGDGRLNIEDFRKILYRCDMIKG